MPSDRERRILDAFAQVSAAAPRPASPARRVSVRSGFPLATLAGGVLVVLAVAALGLVNGRPVPPDVAGSSPTVAPPSSVPVAVASPSHEASAAPATTPAPTVTPTETPEPTVGPCAPDTLRARITSWEGAAGSRIATVDLVHDGSRSCLLASLGRPQLVDGRGVVLIDGRDPRTTTSLMVEPGEHLTTMIAVANYCGPAPVAPVSVAVVQPDGASIVAAPAAASDTAVPDCLGPGQPAQVDMHPWAP